MLPFFVPRRILATLFLLLFGTSSVWATCGELNCKCDRLTCMWFFPFPEKERCQKGPISLSYLANQCEDNFALLAPIGGYTHLQSSTHIEMREGYFPSLDETKFRNLNIIAARYSGLIGQAPDLSPFKELKQLDLGYNSLIGNPFDYVTGMRLAYWDNGVQVSENLEVINLENNNFSGVIDTHIRLLTNLKILNLSGNSFSGSIHNIISTMNKLEVLNLERNDFYNNQDAQDAELYDVLKILTSNKLKTVNLRNSGIATNQCRGDLCPTNALCSNRDCLLNNVICKRAICSCRDRHYNQEDPSRDTVAFDGVCLPYQTRLIAPESHIQHDSFKVDVNVGQLDIENVQVKLQQYLPNMKVEDISAYSDVTVFPNAGAVFDNLQPGSKYKVVITSPHLDPAPQIDVLTACSCISVDGESTGAPLKFETFQVQGHVTFTFRDNSYCEDGYSFSRRDTGTQNLDEAEKFVEDYLHVREASTEVIAFTRNFFYFGNQDCDEDINPKFQASDNISQSNLIVGQYYVYDINAIGSPYSFGNKRSDPSTILHQVLWEASVSGIVTLSKEAGRLPVDGVEVQYQLRTAPGNDSTVIPDTCSKNDQTRRSGNWCSTMTGPGGNFKIELKLYHDSLNNDDEFPLFLRFQKQTGDITHSFLCNDGSFDCSNPNEASIFLKHLDLDTPANVIDDTTTLFRGTITIADTSDCPIPKAEVCLKIHNIRNSAIIEGSCVETDQNGVYRVPAVLGTLVSPEVNYYDHNFQPVKNGFDSTLYKTGIKIEPGEDYGGHNFKDITKASIVVEVAGGICNSVLGTSTVKVSIPSCNAWVGDEHILEERYKQAFNVPAHEVKVELQEIDDKDGTPREHLTSIMIVDKVRAIDLRELVKEDEAKTETEDHIPDGVSTSETDVEFAPNSIEENAIKDAEEEEKDREELKLVRFQATGIDDISVSLQEYNGSSLMELNKAICFSDDGDHAKESFYTVHTGTLIEVYPTIIESFGEDIMTCSKFPAGTKLIYHNRIGVSDNRSDQEEQWFQKLISQPGSENIVAALMECNPSCEAPLAYSYGSKRMLSSKLFFSGIPNITGNFLKSIKLTLQRPDQLHHNAEHTAQVAVTGDVTISEKFSVPVPTHKPLLALRDPPGGRSYAYYHNVQTTLRAEVENIERYTGFTADSLFQAGANSASEACVGFGGLFCTLIVQLGTEGGVSVGANTEFLTGLTDKTNEASWTTTWSYSTSDDPWLAGKYSDTFLVPNIKLQFSKVQTIFLDSITSCPGKKEQLKFDFDDKDKNKPAFAFISRYDVQYTELVALNDLRDEAHRNATEADNADAKERALKTISKLNESIDNWTQFLKDHDETSMKAKNGNLSSPNAWFDSIVGEKMQEKWEKERDELYKNYLLFSVQPQPKEVWESENEQTMKNKWRKELFPKSHYTGLIPKELKDKAIGLHDDSNIEDNVNLITFDGGGSELQYELSSHHMEVIGSKLGSPEDNMNWDAYLGGEGETELQSFASIKVNLSMHGVASHVKSHRGSDSAESETAIGFVLGDDDIDDVFDVQVFLDDTYGTFVFNTFAGKSKCPHEEGTANRQIPSIIATAKHEGQTMPDESILFNVELQNIGVTSGSFVLFEDKREGGPYLNDGDLSAPQVYENIESLESISTLVSFSRPPHDYSFDAIKLFFQPECEYTMDGPQVQLEEVKLENPLGSEELQFLEPCPRIEWASNILNDKSFLFNIDSEEERESKDGLNRIAITIRNLNPIRPLNTQVTPDGRLESVDLMYRQIGSVAWNKGNLISAPGSSEVTTQNLIDYEENTFGYIIGAFWSIDGFADGLYEIEARSTCTSSIGSPADFNTYSTDRILGAIDLTAPILFGKPQPSNRDVLLIGQAVSFEFVEDVMCGGAARNRIEVTIEGLAQNFDNQETNNLLSTCRGRFVSFVFDEITTESLSSKFGAASKAMVINLSDVQDLHGNTMVPVEYQYQVGAASGGSKSDRKAHKLSTSVNLEEDLIFVGGEHSDSQDKHARSHDIDEIKKHMNTIGGIGLLVSLSVSMIVGVSGFVWADRRQKKRDKYSVIL